jgi:hypothetical protein
MTYDVKWIQSALDDLSEAWVSADSPMRAEINRAVNALDHLMERDPWSISESREPGEWVCFSDPLGALIEIDTNRRTV